VARARSRNNTPERDSLLGAAFLSALLHAAALAGAFVVWPFVSPPLEMQSDVVPVDLLTVADITNVAPQEKAPEPTPPEPEPVPVEVPPPPEEIAAAAEPPPPPPDDDAPALEPEPEKKEPEKPRPPEPPAQRYALAIPRAKPKPEKPKDEFDVDKILKSLDSTAQSKEKRAAPAKATADRSLKSAGAQTALTASEMDALKGRLGKCWNVPVGAPDPAALVFRVKFNLNEDGTVAARPELLDRGGLGDPYFRAAADAAIRAIQICGPYDLPPEKYAGEFGWNEITVEFDPRKMAGY
jgi:outer membrane biosynthesis protein TonB